MQQTGQQSVGVSSQRRREPGQQVGQQRQRAAPYRRLQVRQRAGHVRHQSREERRGLRLRQLRGGGKGGVPLSEAGTPEPSHLATYTCQPRSGENSMAKKFNKI